MPYQVVLHREAAKALPTLPRHVQDAAYECLEQILPVRPLMRISGKLKQLHGRLAGVYQYALPAGYRLRYRVEEQAQRVIVLYVGPHP
jgi:mRNA-degrading endonuclease RelE of RelBE toxin-antitoxin system